MTGRVALVIPLFNGGPRFERVIEMWRAQRDVGQLTILCPDSGSTDDSRQIALQTGARVPEVDPGSFSHGGTRNRAVAQLSEEFVILSVQDALPLSTALAADLVAPLAADPTLCASFGRQRPRPGCHPVLAERIGAWAGGHDPVVQELGDQRWEQLDPWERLARIRYDHVIAAMRRSVWERLPFAPLSFGEDVDWAARVIRDGGRIVFVPDAVVEHSHDRSAWDEARRIYCDHRNLARLVGLVAVPSVRRIGANVAAAREHYAKLVDAAEGVDATTRSHWHAWAHRLALYENWAQYLGARFARRWWFRPIDRWLRRGI